jgi:hypothetical protein
MINDTVIMQFYFGDLSIMSLSRVSCMFVMYSIHIIIIRIMSYAYVKVSTLCTRVPY